ncbi:hypothetical protein [Pseudanabaena sp. UWO310]|uniref:hypothetical protein n=1 Tax=Pseudanabaena sp. UWO310 TaxID=2480795 RepID=UPI001157CAED|nr:hypothetical protein [Pseudanabaena sp. UWO310]TYQ27272.1 hypothetical protein PseudUWO310_16100 [Pseudanabaena sp. UWO310]
MISTHDLKDLPSIDILMFNLQSLATLDSILSPEWEYRYYSFNSNWAKDTSLASLNNGSGNHLFVVFDSYGCLIKGFDHEAPINHFNPDKSCIFTDILDSVPPHFKDYLQEVSLIPEETTFCIWRNYSDVSWKVGEINFQDGSEELLPFLVYSPQQYQKWAEEYYEINIKIESIIHIFSRKALTSSIIYALNPKASIELVNKDLQEIGYNSES